MTPATKQWLNAASWETVIATNEALCQTKQAPHQMREQKATIARQLWQQNASKTMPLLEAIEVCRRCTEIGPFVCANATTFAELGQKLLAGTIESLPSVEAQIVRTTVAHYIAGRVLRKELLQVLPLLQTRPITARHGRRESPDSSGFQRQAATT